jgi:Tfp pilus assembly protein PilF
VASESRIERAAGLFQRAFAAQLRGDLAAAEALYKESLAIQPTAEAHTFLGWTYSMAGRLSEAIAECERAIAVDPEFGNPYNDIGAYLLELGRIDDAIPWLERAKQAPRYEPRHYPFFNLGRAYLAKQMLGRALAEFEGAVRAQPDFEPARTAVDALRRRLN